MLTITYGVSGKKMFLLLFAGHIYEKRNFCLLAEEFPFIFLTNWSVVEAMYFRLSIQVLFISKTFQYFHMSIPQASYNIASGSLCPSSVPFIFFYLFIYFFFFLLCIFLLDQELSWTWLHRSCRSLNIGGFSNNLTTIINQFYLFVFFLKHSHLHTPSLPILPTIVVETWEPFH